MRSQKECAPTVQSQGANGTKPRPSVAQIEQKDASFKRVLQAVLGVAVLLMSAVVWQ